MTRLLIDVILVSSFVWLASWFGYEIVDFLLPSIASRVRSIALGSLLGGSLASLFYLTCTLFNIAPVISIATVTVMGLILRRQRRRRGLTGTAKLSFRLESATFVTSSGIGFLLISHYSLWTIAFGAFLLLYAPVLRWMGSQGVQFLLSRRLLLTLVLVACCVTLLVLQPDWWHSRYPDSSFSESLSWSLALFGPDVAPGFSGISLHGYHYLAYLWSGVISHFGTAEPFVILNLVLPFLSGFSMSAIILTQPRCKGGPSASIPLTIALVSFARTASGFLSEEYSFWAMLAYIGVSYQASTTRRLSNSRYATYGVELLLACIGTIAVLGKATSLPVIVAVGTASALLRYSSTDASPWRRITRSAPWHLVAVGCSWILWFGSAVGQQTARVQTQSPLQLVSKTGLSQTLWQVTEILERLPMVIVIGAFALIAARRANHTDSRWKFVVVGVTAAITTLTVLMTAHPDARDYALRASVFVILATLALDPEYRIHWRALSPSSQTALIGGGLCLIAIILFYEFFLPAPMAWLWSAFPSGPARWIPRSVEFGRFPALLVVAISLGLYITSANKPLAYGIARHLGQVWSRSLTIFLLSIASLTSIHRWADAQAWRSFHPDVETQEVGQFLRSNTPTDSVIASNAFCCYNDNWPQSTAAAIREIPTNYVDGNEYGGANYQLVAVSQRQFLLAGPRFVVPGNVDHNFVAQLLEWSVDYGASGDNDVADALQRSGAHYYIVDKWALSQSLPRYDRAVLFENLRYLVIGL
jgi:hypothetical protein